MKLSGIRPAGPLMPALTQYTRLLEKKPSAQDPAVNLDPTHAMPRRFGLAPI